MPQDVRRPETEVIVISPVPRAQMSDADLAVFRSLADVQRDVVRELPNCVFLDVERLLEAERTAEGNWRRPFKPPRASRVLS